MGKDAQHRGPEGEAVDEPEQRLDAHDAIYNARQEALGDNRMLLDQLGEVVEAGRDGEREEAHANDGSHVT